MSDSSGTGGRRHILSKETVYSVSYQKPKKSSFRKKTMLSSFHLSQVRAKQEEESQERMGCWGEEQKQSHLERRETVHVVLAPTGGAARLVLPEDVSERLRSTGRHWSQAFSPSQSPGFLVNTSPPQGPPGPVESAPLEAGC